MPKPLISIEKSDHVATVRFDRPERANAVSQAFLVELESVARSFRDDVETRCVVFTGNGKHFCSGADLSERRDTAESILGRQRQLRAGERAMEALLAMDQVTIAAWNGAAMGGGACIATALDFRVAADNAFAQYPEVLLGMNLMWRSLPLTVRLVGTSRAMRLVAGGERVNAETLLAWGMVDEVVPAAELSATAQRWAEDYAGKPPIAVQMIKRSINAIAGMNDAALMHMDADQNLLTATTDDRGEAARSYLDKRRGDFSGQ
ncbi:MAG: enoyl-CoA hydratase/isomerase family protein [Pseudomonadaceae bacterium]|nr:enoyl-CoA hydratase/isomerase family protein [Pseudomonadaceae bacterium]